MESPVLNETAVAGAGPETGSRHVLWLVSLGVLLGSSTWLAGSAVAPSLKVEWGLSDGGVAALTSAVQLGFIVGTFGYALANVADRFSARGVFLVSALAGATVNGAFATCDSLTAGVVLRFLTGVTLAGIYPVGMKLVASWFPHGLGWRLGVMVGSLVLGTSMPFLVRAAGTELPWRTVIRVASVLAVLGGLLVRFGVPPLLRTGARAVFDPHMMWKVFRHREFRWNSFGYFGHMWELYAFWSLLALFLARQPEPLGDGPRAWLVFTVVAVGFVGCVVGGFWSRKVGERNVALVSLGISALACLGSGLLPGLPTVLVVVFLLVWGFFVVSDSPQFSALAARYCPKEYTGTALTVQNGVGFAVSILSIQGLPLLAGAVTWPWLFVLLAPGPLFGAWSMLRLPARPPA